MSTPEPNSEIETRLDILTAKVNAAKDKWDDVLGDAPNSIPPTVTVNASQETTNSKLDDIFGTNQKPNSTIPEPANVPEELLKLRQWVNWEWKWNEKKQDWDKPPINPNNRKPVNAHDPATWTDFNSAVNAAKRYKCAGVGIVLTEKEPFAGVDMDDCRNPETGEIKTWAQEMVKVLNSYTEVTPSKTGLRVWVRASMDKLKGNKKPMSNGGVVEFYDRKRYFTVTGLHVDGTPITIEPRQEEFERLHAEVFSAPKSNEPLNTDEKPLPDPVSPPMSDEQILSLARNASNGGRFKRLYDDGDLSDYGGDHSRADAALTAMLAFYTQNPEQIEDLFRGSKLNRDKFEDREDYRERTIGFVLQKVNGEHNAAIARGEPGKFYNPESFRKRSPGFNDHGNAQRLVNRHGDVLRYCHDFRKWLIWDGRRWAVDTTKQAEILAKDTMHEFLKKSLTTDNEKGLKFAVQSLNQPRIESMLKSAQSELPIKADELDKQPLLLNFLNGTVDLQTGELHPHDSKKLITKLVHHDYKPNATAPLFMQFLREIGLEPLTDYLQKAFGYSLTGLTSEKAVFVCYGAGDNGKSTLLTLWRSLLPEYSTELQITTLVRRTQEDNVTQADLADLCGARFVKTSETEEGFRLSESKVKRITQGMGKIKACRKYENPIIFEETHKLWVDANHCPVIRGSDNAIWNRMHLIPFNVVIPATQKDPKLLDRLLQEAEGILAWAVAGAVRWHKERLQRPPEVQEAVTKWRDTSDPLKDFFEECCMFDPAKVTPIAEVLAAYEQWCAMNREHPLHRNVFNARMEARGCKRPPSPLKVDGKNTKVWQGVEIITAWTLGSFDSVPLPLPVATAKSGKSL